MSGKLYIVATPIGNLADFTFRALEVLKTMDYILCEDTRVTKKLLDHYQIQKPLLSYHHHSDARKINEIKALLAENKNLALVTDAGTPGISDPGNELIQRLIPRSGGVGVGSPIEIIPIPGPSAVTAALSISGFPTDKFIFLGFPPHKSKRQKFFKDLAEQKITAIFFESGHRILKCLDDLKNFHDPKREIVICRELTKKFETFYRGTIGDLNKEALDERGEFVIVINAYGKSI